MTKEEKRRLKNASDNFFTKLLNKEFEELDVFGSERMFIKITKEEYEELEPFFHARQKTEYEIGEIEFNVSNHFVLPTNVYFITEPNETEKVYIQVLNDVFEDLRMLVSMHDLIDMCISGFPRETPYKSIHLDAEG